MYIFYKHSNIKIHHGFKDVRIPQTSFLESCDIFVLVTSEKSSSTIIQQTNSSSLEINDDTNDA